MPSLQILGLGAMNMDYFYRVTSLLKDGEAEVEEAHAFPGGSAANTIYALGKLGVPCGFVGMVGDDEAGEALIGDLSRIGVDTTTVGTAKGARTGSVVAIVDREGKRALYVHPGANGLLHRTGTTPGTPTLPQAALVHTSAFVGDKQFRWQRETLAALPDDTKLSFAPGALYARRGLEALLPILKRTHLLFLNRTELKELTGEGLETGANRCIQAGCQKVVVTLGKGLRRGWRRCCCLAATAENALWVQAAPGDKQVVDTTGAGDAFAAGFIFGELNKKPAEECGLLGDLMAGFCIAELGARTGMPTRAELGQAYKSITGEDL